MEAGELHGVTWSYEGLQGLREITGGATTVRGGVQRWSDESRAGPGGTREGGSGQGSKGEMETDSQGVKRAKPGWAQGRGGARQDGVGHHCDEAPRSTTGEVAWRRGT